MKRLIDGERKVINASRQYAMFKHKGFGVAAYRFDSETPCIEFELAFGANISEGSLTYHMTDTEALDLIERLQRALSILPSSK